MNIKRQQKNNNVDFREKQMSRRSALTTGGKAAAGVAVAAIIAGAGGFFAGTNSVTPIESAPVTVTNTVTKTEQIEVEHGHGDRTIGYAIGKGIVATLDLEDQRLLSVNLNDVIPPVTYSNHRLNKLGHAWGGDKSSGKAYGIDPVSGDIVGSVNLPGRWSSLLPGIDPKGEFMYVLNLQVAPSVDDEAFMARAYTKDKLVPSPIYKIDTTNPDKGIIAEVEAARFCCDVYVDDNYIWTADQLDTLVTRIDVNSFTVKDTIPASAIGDDGQNVGGSMLTGSPDGRLLFYERAPAANWSGIDIEGPLEEIVIDAKTLEVIKRIPFKDQGMPIIDEFSPDGKYCSVTHPASVSIFDVEKLEIVGSVPAAGPGLGITYSPDSQFLYIPNRGSSSISVVELDSATVVKEIPLPSAVTDIIPSPSIWWE